MGEHSQDRGLPRVKAGCGAEELKMGKVSDWSRG